MTFSLDIRTLSVVLGLVSMTMSLIMIYVKLTQKTYKGFVCWTIAAISLSAGMMLYSMRGVFSDFLTVILANLFVLLFFVLITYGLNFYLKRFVSCKWFLLLFSLYLLSFVYFTYFNPSIDSRIVVISIFVSAFLFYSAWTVLKHSKNLEIKPNGLLIFSFLVLGIFSVVRIFATLISNNRIISFMDPSSLHSMTFVLCILSLIVTFIGLITLNMQRVEKEFLSTQKEVTFLKGIIPICMHCKGIRDDKGSWKQLEKYISEASDIQFSHGICNSCMEKFYPDVKNSKS